MIGGLRVKNIINSSILINKYKNLPIALKATVWFIICSVLQKAVSIITMPLFTRILTTEQYGQYTIYNSWQQIFAMICTFRLEYAVFNKGMSKYSERKDEYTSAMQGLTNLITVIIFLVYLIFHQQINSLTELSTFMTILLFVEIFFGPAVSFWSLRKRYDFEYKQVVAVTLLMSILNPVLGLVAVNLTDDKGTARILSCIAVQICFGLILYVYNLRKGKKIISKDLWKFAILFNLPLIPHYFSSYILEQSDRIMIQKFWGLADVALYGVAYNAGTIM